MDTFPNIYMHIQISTYTSMYMHIVTYLCAYNQMRGRHLTLMLAPIFPRIFLINVHSKNTCIYIFTYVFSL